MRRGASGLVLVLASLSLAAEELPKGEKVEFEAFRRPYFEKNNSGLKGETSHLILRDFKEFETIFGVGFVMKGKPKLLPETAFEKQLVLAVITRGPVAVDYTIEKAEAAAGTMYLYYEVITPDNKGSTAKFASPVIVAVPKEGIKKVAFVEKGKKPVIVDVRK